MPRLITALLVTCLLAAASVRCFGQQLEDSPDSVLTREQWQQRVEEARRRSQEFVANARTQTAVPPPPNQEEAEATDRAMHDPTLRQGDIISTKKGLFVFVGRDEKHQPTDFVSVLSEQHPQEGLRYFAFECHKLYRSEGRWCSAHRVNQEFRGPGPPQRPQEPAPIG